MVYRIYVQRKENFNSEAENLTLDIQTFLGIKNLKNIKLYNRYDVENLEKSLFDYAITTVFSEPQTDNYFLELPKQDAIIFAVEYLPGQFDQRADSAPNRTGRRCPRVSCRKPWRAQVP